MPAAIIYAARAPSAKVGGAFDPVGILRQVTFGVRIVHISISVLLGVPMQPHILLACMPKSGSTFISNAISNIADIQKVMLVPAYERREQELCEVCLVDNDDIGYVSQQHIRCSSWTEKLCEEYGISVIVLIRSLFDVVISVRDHVRSESPVGSMFFLETEHLNRSDAELEQFLARMAIPWYINFYMGWRKSEIARIFMYEDFIADPNRVLTEMLSHAGVTITPERASIGIEAAREQESRINVGEVGRGAALKPEAVSTIMEMLAAYPEIQNDRYVQMMKTQAGAILRIAADNNADKTRPAAPPRSVGRGANKAHKLPVKRFAASAGLITLALLYYVVSDYLNLNQSSIGYAGNFVVPAVCVFIAARLLTRAKKVRRVPVPIRQRSEPELG